LHTVLLEESVMTNEVAVPPETCHDNNDDALGAIVVGDAVKLSVKGTVTVRVCGPTVPPGPVAVME
jgi:hypothetical protein